MSVFPKIVRWKLLVHIYLKKFFQSFSKTLDRPTRLLGCFCMSIRKSWIVDVRENKFKRFMALFNQIAPAEDPTGGSYFHVIFV